MNVFREGGNTRSSVSLDGGNGGNGGGKGGFARDKGGGKAVDSESIQVQILLLQMVLKVSSLLPDMSWCCTEFLVLPYTAGYLMDMKTYKMASP